MADPDYFTLAEFLALPDCSGFSEPDIVDAAAYFTTIVEREVGGPMLPRSFTVTTNGNDSDSLRLPHPYVRSITSATVDGAAVSTTNLAFSSGSLFYKDSTLWASGFDNVVVTYVAGEYATVPADIKSAVMWATRDRLISQASTNVQDPRQQSMTNDLGGSTVFLLPGEKRPTGYPELDAVIASYKRRPFYGSI